MEFYPYGYPYVVPLGLRNALMCYPYVVPAGRAKCDTTTGIGLTATASPIRHHTGYDGVYLLLHDFGQFGIA